jgi:hypothetical protein
MDSRRESCDSPLSGALRPVRPRRKPLKGGGWSVGRDLSATGTLRADGPISLRTEGVKQHESARPPTQQGNSHENGNNWQVHRRKGATAIGIDRRLCRRDQSRLSGNSAPRELTGNQRSPVIRTIVAAGNHLSSWGSSPVQRHRLRMLGWPHVRGWLGAGKLSESLEATNANGSRPYALDDPNALSCWERCYSQWKPVGVPTGAHLSS